MRISGRKPGVNKRLGLILAVAGLMIALLGSAIVPPEAAAIRTGFGFAPQRYQSGYTYGNGIFFAPYQFTVYTEPNVTSEVIGEFRWGHKTATNSVDVFSPEGDHRTASADHVFFCFYPELDVAMMAVVGDTEDGWVEVIYDQKSQKTGWIKAKVADGIVDRRANNTTATAKDPEPIHFGVYQTWLEFMKLNAKASGIYWLSGVKEYNRSIRTADKDEARLIPVTIVRDLKVRHVRGNWLLVEVLDFQRNTPIGWVRWRSDNGELMVFPNISGEHLPIVTTAF